MTKKSTKTSQNAGAAKKAPAKKNKKFSRLQGVRDILPQDYKYWELVDKKIYDLASYYSFNRVRVPLIERATLYEESLGKNSNVVSKKLYTFTDKNQEKVALRPDATPGTVRAIVDRGVSDTDKTRKIFWLGSVFKFEQPQSKKLRQQHQFSFDVLGDKNPVVDVQLILIAFNFFSELQIDTQVQINSIGCSECRKEYVKKLSSFYKERGKRSKLCNTCKNNFTKDPFLLLSCEEDSCAQVREDAPQIIDFLCEECREHFIAVLEYLDELNIPYNLSPFLTRNFDYYTGSVFEFVPLEKEEDSSEEKNKKRNISFGGGGRYDELIEKMGGIDIPACGFAVNIERAVQKIRESNIPIRKDEDDIIFIAQLGEDSRKKAFLIFEEMRKAGYKVRQLFIEDTLQGQLEEAKFLNARYSLILGQKEYLDNTIMIRDMESGTQEVIDQKKIYAEIDKRMNNNELL